jgi:hypothetical protein
MDGRLDTRDSQGESSTLLVQQQMSRQGNPPDVKPRSIDQHCKVNCSEGEWHEASSNEKSLKRAAMLRTVRNKEWWRDQEDNDGRNRERIDKVVDRIKSQFKQCGIHHNLEHTFSVCPTFI